MRTRLEAKHGSFRVLGVSRTRGSGHMHRKLQSGREKSCTKPVAKWFRVHEMKKVQGLPIATEAASCSCPSTVHTGWLPPEQGVLTTSSKMVFVANRVDVGHYQ